MQIFWGVAMNYITSNYANLCKLLKLIWKFFAGVRGSNTTLTFLVEPRDVVVARGQSAVLDCLVDNDFLPASGGSTSATLPQSSGPIEQFQIVWFQNGAQIDLPDARRRLLANGSLYFEKVVIIHYN